MDNLDFTTTEVVMMVVTATTLVVCTVCPVWWVAVTAAAAVTLTGIWCKHHDAVKKDAEALKEKRNEEGG